MLSPMTNPSSLAPLLFTIRLETVVPVDWNAREAMAVTVYVVPLFSTVWGIVTVSLADVPKPATLT